MSILGKQQSNNILMASVCLITSTTPLTFLKIDACGLENQNLMTLSGKLDLSDRGKKVVASTSIIFVLTENHAE